MSTIPELLKTIRDFSVNVICFSIIIIILEKLLFLEQKFLMIFIFKLKSCKSWLLKRKEMSQSFTIYNFTTKCYFLQKKQTIFAII